MPPAGRSRQRPPAGEFAMKPICWLVAALATVGLAVFVTAQSDPRANDDDVALHPNNSDQFCRAIDVQCEAALARVLEKDRIVKSLLRDELTLDQAAEGFRAVIGDDTKAIEYLQTRYGATGDEIFYRNVVTFATTGQPTSVAAVARRLEDELRQRFPTKTSVELTHP